MVVGVALSQGFSLGSGARSRGLSAGLRAFSYLNCSHRPSYVTTWRGNTHHNVVEVPLH